MFRCTYKREFRLYPSRKYRLCAKASRNLNNGYSRHSIMRIKIARILKCAENISDSLLIMKNNSAQ